MPHKSIKNLVGTSKILKLSHGVGLTEEIDKNLCWPQDMLVTYVTKCAIATPTGRGQLKSAHFILTWIE